MYSFSNKIMKVFFLAMGLCCLFSLSSCRDDPGSDPDPDPVEPSPNGKTYVNVVNNTEYSVYVYVDQSPYYEIPPENLRYVSAGGSLQWEASPTERTSFYFQYLIPVGSVTIPYFSNHTEHVKREPITTGMTTTLQVPPIGSIQTDSSYVLIKNDSSNSAWFQQDAATRNPFGSSASDIPAGGDAIFIFENANNNISLANCTIGNTTRRNFPNTTLEKGKIYSFFYDGRSNPSLFLVEFFDPEMPKNIWTIPTFVGTPALGRFFTVGLFSSRQNPRNDGYILAGQINYDNSTILAPCYGALPYLGMISPTGEIRERRINLAKNPSGLYIRDFVEDSNELIYAGQAFYDEADGVGRPFILSTNAEGRENYFHDAFIDDLDTVFEMYGKRVVKENLNSYAIGCDLWELFDDWESQIYIAKVNKVSWDEVTHEGFWKSSETDNVRLADIVYDQTQNIFVVVGIKSDSSYTERGSVVYFVDAANGTLKYPTVNINNYFINRFFSNGQEYFAAGGYQGASTTRGFIMKVDVVNGTVGSNNPWMIDSSIYDFGQASIFNVLPEDDGTLVLSGWCKDLNSNNDFQPWILKYNLIERKSIWEQIYRTLEGYYVYSVHHNAIGSYLLEIYNEVTYHSYLVSTDLYGRMSSNELPPLPRNTSPAFTALQPGTPGISVVVTPISGDVELSTPAALALPKGQSGNILVSGSWSSYQWYVDGASVAGSSSSYTFNTSGRSAGIYTVTVVVTNNAQEKRSASCRVTVTN